MPEDFLSRSWSGQEYKWVLGGFFLLLLSGCIHLLSGSLVIVNVSALTQDWWRAVVPLKLHFFCCHWATIVSQFWKWTEMNTHTHGYTHLMEHKLVAEVWHCSQLLLNTSSYCKQQEVSGQRDGFRSTRTRQSKKMLIIQFYLFTLYYTNITFTFFWTGN